jgi:hypothetical protein
MIPKKTKISRNLRNLLEAAQTGIQRGQFSLRDSPRSKSSIEERAHVRITHSKDTSIILHTSLEDWNSRSLVVEDTVDGVRKHCDTAQKRRS